VAGSTLTLKYRDAMWSSIGVPEWIVRLERIGWTFVLLMLTFVVYRANSLHDSVLFYRDIFSIRLLRWFVLRGEPATFHVITFTSWTWSIVVLVIIGDVLARRGFVLEKLSAPVQIAIYNMGAALIAYSWITHSAAQPFLYYRF
jgi:hypothetical protein